MDVSLILSGKPHYILLTEILNVILSSQKLMSTSSGKYTYWCAGVVFEVDPDWAIGYTIRTPYSITHHFL